MAVVDGEFFKNNKISHDKNKKESRKKTWFEF